MRLNFYTSKKGKMLSFAIFAVISRCYIVRISEQLQDEIETIKQEEGELMHELRLNKE